MSLADFTNDELLIASLRIEGLAVISGMFKGGIYNGIDVYITPSGYIHGSIKAVNLIIAGRVNGDVEVKNLKICTSGKLYFNKLQYKDLDIEEGGLLIENRIGLATKQKWDFPQIKTNEHKSSSEYVHFNSSF